MFQQTKRPGTSTSTPFSRRLRSRAPQRNRLDRKGGALVELAICLPILVFLVGATIEVCDMIFLRNSLTAAAYSGTLEVSTMGSSEASVRSKIEASLTATGVSDPTITITAADGTAYDDLAPGQNAKIKVQALVASNLRISGFLQGKNKITVNAQAVK